LKQQQQMPGKSLSTRSTREASTAAASAAAGAADAEPSDHLLQADGKLIVNEEPSTSGKGADNTSVQQQRKQQQQQCHVSCSNSKRASWLGHRPISMLFREHWREVLLMFWFETW
jgi:hypothetical protein